MTIYVDSKNNNGELTNIYIKNSSLKKQFQITFAKKGKFVKKGNSKILVLFDGQTLNYNNGNLTNFAFLKSDFSFNDMNSHAVIVTKLQEQSSIELLNCIENLYKKILQKY